MTSSFMYGMWMTQEEEVDFRAGGAIRLNYPHSNFSDASRNFFTGVQCKLQ